MQITLVDISREIARLIHLYDSTYKPYGNVGTSFMFILYGRIKCVPVLLHAPYGLDACHLYTAESEKQALDLYIYVSLFPNEFESCRLFEECLIKQPGM